MRTHRPIAIGAATLVAILGAATAAQAAYVASGTLYGSDTDVISTVDCAAAIIASTADDQAKTIEAVDIPCTKVTVRIYYTNSAGYAGWTSTVESSWKAIKTLSGGDQLSRLVSHRSPLAEAPVHRTARNARVLGASMAAALALAGCATQPGPAASSDDFAALVDTYLEGAAATSLSGEQIEVLKRAKAAGSLDFEDYAAAIDRSLECIDAAGFYTQADPVDHRADFPQSATFTKAQSPGTLWRKHASLSTLAPSSLCTSCSLNL